MKYIITILLSLAVFGCSSVSKKPAPKPKTKALHKIESKEFDVYLNLFVSNAYAYGGMTLDIIELRRQVQIWMTDNLPSPRIIGICYTPKGKLHIYINKKSWETRSSLEREMLVFHELGHCLFDLPHDSSRNSSDIALSIMHPTGQDTDLYITHYAYYNIQFFHLAKQKREKAKIKMDEINLDSSELRENLRKKRKKLRKIHVLRKSFFKKTKK